jgi:hypothetical protein
MLRFNMDSLEPDIIQIAAELGLRGSGLARLGFELRYVADEKELIPGSGADRKWLREYLGDRLIKAIKQWRTYTFPQTQDEQFLIRAPDLRPEDPNKMPYVFNEFTGLSKATSTAFLLEFQDDILVPVAQAVQDAMRETGQKMHLMMPDVKNKAMYDAVRASVGSDIPLIPQIESIEGIDNMVALSDVPAFSLGINDLTSDILGVPRSSFDYDPLHGNVIHAISHMQTISRKMGKGVYICSSVAERPEGVKALLGLGFDDLSIPLSSVELVRGVISQTDIGKASDLMRRIVDETGKRDVSADEIRKMLEDV